MAQANPSVVLAFRVRDETSAPLQNIENNLKDVGTEVNNTSFSMAQAGQSFVLFGAGLAASAGGLASLAESMGLIPETMQDTVRNVVTAVGAIAALAGGLAQLIPVIRAVAAAERTRAIASAFATALSGPVGIALLAAGLAAAVGAAVVISQFQVSPGQQRTVSGAFNEAKLAIVHGGETISRQPISGTGGGDVIIQAGIIVADEIGLRELERRLSRIRGEERRTRGITQ